MRKPTPSAAAAEFRRLHASGCFVLPNPWDAGTARFLAGLGFRALATTSAGLAYSRGLPDSPTALDVDVVLEHVRTLAAATPLPLNVDFQHGYGADADAVYAQVTRCIEAGAAGLSIEDATGDGEHPLFERDAAVDRVRAARAAIDATGVPAVLTARCEAWLVGSDRPEATAIDRLVAFADAGADCLYAPGVVEPDAVGRIVAAVAPRPVNVLVSRPIPGVTFERLAELGVRRISVGAALARVAWGAFIEAGKALAGGDFAGLAGNAESSTDFDRLFGS